MSNQVTANTPQEDRLLRAFRSMHPEDKEIMVGFAEFRAERKPALKPSLRLIVSKKRRATDAEASA